jgi:uncharacterized protein (DUF1786 family)
MAKKKKSSKSKGKRRSEIRYLVAPARVTGLAGKFKKFLPENTSEQFLVGLMIGGGAAYVLSDETLRGQVIRNAMQTYGSIAQSVEELKEHLADIQAEIVGERAAQA